MAVSLGAHNTATRYIARIRNPEKRRYAKDYAAYLTIPGSAEPGRRDYDLGVMAKQAVEMSLDEILGEEVQ